VNHYNLPIPPITDPLGKHWNQPETMPNLDVMGTHALLSKSEFEGLAEYSTTRPSGVYPGKCWKADGGKSGWHLCWFGEVPDKPDLCANNSLPIIIVGGA